jgi:SAM-dependent methyltransferase
MAIANSEQAEFWSGFAPTWIDLEDLLEKTSRVPGDLAIERLGLAGGEHVVDLGCGTGQTTIKLASRVGSAGTVLGVDIADAMLDRARERAVAAGTPNLTWRTADVQVEALGDGQFDAAFSRFGVMFFSDPVAAFTNIRRALKPGGRLSFVCWQSPLQNEWALVPAMAAMSVTGPVDPPPPGSPGPFAFADEDYLRSVVEGAGWRNIDILAHSDHLVSPEGDIPRLVGMSTRMGLVRSSVQDADEATIAAVMAAVEAELRNRVSDGELRARWSVFLVTAEA